MPRRLYVIRHIPYSLLEQTPAHQLQWNARRAAQSEGLP